jgi:hypothetical protein
MGYILFPLGVLALALLGGIVAGGVAAAVSAPSQQPSAHPRPWSAPMASDNRYAIPQEGRSTNGGRHREALLYEQQRMEQAHAEEEARAQQSLQVAAGDDADGVIDRPDYEEVSLAEQLSWEASTC